MTAINRMTLDVIHHPDIAEWVVHFDEPADTTYIMLGDDVLSVINGEASFDKCEEVVNDEWDIQDDYESDVVRAREVKQSAAKMHIIEVYQPSTAKMMYERFDSEAEANDRVVYINSLETIDWEEIQRKENHE
jgi:hypothetical protein